MEVGGGFGKTSGLDSVIDKCLETLIMMTRGFEGVLLIPCEIPVTLENFECSE